MRQPAVLLLDVDGCLSPLEPSGYATAQLYPGRGSLAVPYDPQVVEALSRLHTAGAFEVRWLTTWEAGELAAWHDLGLGPFEVVERPKRFTRWWKAQAVFEVMSAESARQVVWVDDEIKVGHLQGLVRSRLLVIRPDPLRGLTLAHLAQIGSWSQ